jgi:hypothetical protein
LIARRWMRCEKSKWLSNLQLAPTKKAREIGLFCFVNTHLSLKIHALRANIHEGFRHE